MSWPLATSLSKTYLGAANADDVEKVYLGATQIFPSGGGGPSYDTATQALLDAATTDGYTAASGSTLTALDAFITELKTEGIWTLLDALWLPATNGDSDFATYNLKDPDSHQLTKVNSPTFTSGQGFTGGGTAYLNTNFNPSTDGVNYTLNSAAAGIYQRTNSKVLDYKFGCVDSLGYRIASLWNRPSSGNFAGINSSNPQSSGLPNADLENIGLNYINRNSDLVSIYADGVLFESVTQSDKSIVNEEVYLLGANDKGSLAVPSSDQISMAFIGGDLSSKASGFYSAIQTYMTALGTQV
ncbi:MAG: hypothetical protein ACRBG0_19105 [Lewinella sp.]|uniref:hypothetical protein n=1 Tax=Lewinella sp. TaxID=2004506 RepID=UPI003D6B7189